jgi:hypothetical protein
MTEFVYDLEIKKAIPPKDPAACQKGIEYCDGWHDHANMGISVLGAATVETSRMAVYLDDNLDQFLQLVQAHGKLLIGYNNLQHDDKVIAAIYPEWKDRLAPIPRYDILREIWIAEGYPPTWQGPAQGGYGLDDMAMASFGTGKTGNGALAPIDWQQGRFGKVINYCMDDVNLTLMLYRKIQLDGYLYRPQHKGGGIIELPRYPTLVH